MVEKITKVASEKKLDLTQLKVAISERIAGNGEAVKPVLLNMRRLRA
jgi:ATP-dependent Clp protease ATP-binding subunit ClpA